MKLIIEAFLKAQSEIQNAVMDTTNPHFKSKYASLESVIDAVKPAANKHGIAIMQQSGKDDAGMFVKTILMHKSGETLESKTYLMLDKQNMQGLGSSISYGRRYDLATIFAITQEDDDGNTAVSKPVMQPQKQVQPQPKPETGGVPDFVAQYVIQGGKYHGRKFTDLEKNEYPALAKYVAELEADAKAKGVQMTGPLARFVATAHAFLESKDKN